MSGDVVNATQHPNLRSLVKSKQQRAKLTLSIYIMIIPRLRLKLAASVKLTLRDRASSVLHLNQSVSSAACFTVQGKSELPVKTERISLTTFFRLWKLFVKCSANATGSVRVFLLQLASIHAASRCRRHLHQTQEELGHGQLQHSGDVGVPLQVVTRCSAL